MSILDRWRGRPASTTTGETVAPGERALARATARDGTRLVGTREALYLGAHRIAWEEVERADWDLDSATLRVTELGTWGQVRPDHQVEVEEPARLLQLVRERVTASIVLQRHVPVGTGRRRRGLRVIARRAPGTHDDPAWFFEYDEGVDPADPEVHAAATAALAAARHELGLP